jgi:hypothetical protein
MALPLAPIAGIALRYGVVALATYAVARSIPPGRVDQRAEDALDDLEEGPSLGHARDRSQYNGALRFRRIVRLGTGGPGLEIDVSALGRLRMRRV